MDLEKRPNGRFYHLRGSHMSITTEGDDTSPPGTGQNDDDAAEALGLEVALQRVGRRAQVSPTSHPDQWGHQDEESSGGSDR